MVNKTSKKVMMMRILVSLFSGMIFGIAIEKSGVHEPNIVKKQMSFEIFFLMKLILSASASGMFIFGCISKMDETFMVAVTDCIESLDAKSVRSVAMGAVILGCGMALSGACPETVMVQVGAGVPSSGFTVAGAMFGALTYALIEPEITRILRQERPYRYSSLSEYMHIPFGQIAFPLSILLGAITWMLEKKRPWSQEVEKLALEGTEDNLINNSWKLLYRLVLNPIGNDKLSGFAEQLLEMKAWPPCVAGIIIGSLQLPVVFCFRSVLRTYTAFLTVAAQPKLPIPNEDIPYLQHFKRGFQHWWRVFFLFGAALGAQQSAQASATYGKVQGVTQLESLLGGFLILFGSSLSSGSISGHLSGMCLTMLLSLVALPCVLIGGILTDDLLDFF